ncbi:hypothetical protein BDR05DRAFT_1005250 [Suillus weaverae]|nr:hypothetical protein BDR05DRAFT_1005250 [Suillus weaverae]
MSFLAESLYLDSVRNPESSCADHDDSDSDRVVNQSPDLQASSNDEYTGTPPKNNTTTIYSTPTSRSEPDSPLSRRARNELGIFCRKIYGDCLCLVTLKDSALILQIAHVVQRRSKSDDFTLYEYCLGLEYRHFHVDSRRNMFYLSPDWHAYFDRNGWFLLPDTHTLEEVNGHVTGVIESRKNPTSSVGKSFRSKWRLKTKTQYTLISVSCTYPFFRGSVAHQYPYLDLPLLECHVAPPFAVINAGPKCERDQIDHIVLRRYPQQTEGSTMESDAKELQQRLTLLCDTWDLFMDPDVRAAAKAWEKSETGGKRKREQSDAGQTDGRSTRSKTRSGHGGDRKRKRSPNSSGATLTEHAVSHLEKRQKADNWKTSIRHWVAESTRASSLEPNLPLDFTSILACITVDSTANV